MKKFILGGAFAAALVLGAAYSYNNSNTGLSDLQILNAEALAHSETLNTGPGKTYNCPGIFTGKGKMCMCSNGQPCTEDPC